MSVLLHLSDTHFGTEQAPVSKALLRLAAEVRPDIALLSGDITQRARLRQFTAAREFMDALAAPVKLVIPGNHDIPLFDLPSRIFSPYGNYHKTFGRSLEPSFADPNLLVLCLNTTRPWRHKDGELSREQIGRVASRLQSATSRQLRIVVVHQPIQVISDSDSVNLLHGHRDAAKRWAEAGADLILSGHIHFPYVRMLNGSADGRNRPVWIVSAGTAISSRVRQGHPNSVNLIRYDAQHVRRECIVERYDYHAKPERFVIAETSRLALG
ncbi:3',5'-cyclic AMP phosphodiesterase CpdA [Paucimonas lemoignei]|uniref:3',5'-cyclic AMP phosphodiesterase CpdA n=1 Tax=Paucimonas lemoignei TaxID=29443 RepID=A0A4R3I0S1_PAULE|nr:metallophosphoesterase [Paucimonas lemoignei]TCS39316.1 3',5'-cyclic AMP phosphodiesterase CpdA [Paucimonas lemoignei]